MPSEKPEPAAPEEDGEARLQELLLLREQLLQETREVAQAVEERVRSALRTDPPHPLPPPAFRRPLDKPAE